MSAENERQPGPWTEIANNIVHARATFPRVGSPEINHEPFDPKPQPRPEVKPRPRVVLQRNGADEDSINAILSPKGEWIFPPSTERGLYRMAHGRLRTVMATKLAPLLDCVDPSLNSSKDPGFNTHSFPHLASVDRVGTKLLQMKKNEMDPKTLRDTIGLFIIDVWNHDIGNVFNRPVHSVTSAHMTPRIWPDLLTNTVLWQRSRRSIMFHEEKLLSAYIAAAVIRQGKKELVGQELIEFLRKDFPPEFFALFCADKWDVGRNRFPTKHVKTAESRRMDEHGAVNFFGEASTPRLVDQGKMLRVIFKYMPGLVTPEDLNTYKFIFEQQENGKEGNGKVNTHAFVPDVLRQAQQAFGVDSFNAWRTQFWAIYFNRMRLSIYTAFALLPSVQQVKLEMLDTRLNGQEQGGRSWIFTPDSIEAFMDEIREEHHLPVEKKDPPEEFDDEEKRIMGLQ